jgi:mono/diheme cytochrome c family protein
MENNMRPYLAIAGLLFASIAYAETPRDFLTRFEKEAGATASAERGARFFTAKQGGEWSCASCHTDKPTQAGRHAKTDKPITALAPAANAERFTDAAKVDKWFRRNCNDTLNRVCTPQEKADVTAWLLSLK